MCIQTTTPNHVAVSNGTSARPLRSSRKIDDADIDALCASFENLSFSDGPNDNSIRSFCASFEDLSLSQPEDMEIDDPMDVDALFCPLLGNEPQAMEVDEYLSPLFNPPQDMKVDGIFPPLLEFGAQYMEIDAVFSPQLAPSRRD